MKIYTHYSPPPSTGVVFDEETLTQQHFRDECDVNKIVANFERGILPPSGISGRSNSPMFGDFSNIPDLREAQQRIREAKEAFYQLPATTRRRFDNDPVELLKFLEDENNRSEAETLGLIEKKVEVAASAASSSLDGGESKE